MLARLAMRGGNFLVGDPNSKSERPTADTITDAQPANLHRGAIDAACHWYFRGRFRNVVVAVDLDLGVESADAFRH